MSDGPDELTLLEPATGASTAKTVTAAGVLPADHSYLHRAHVVTVTSFEDLAGVLESVSRDMPALYLVRGQIAPDADRASMRRTHAPADGTAPTLLPCPRRWVLLDLDSWRADLPAAEFAGAVRTWAEHARAALPTGMREAACWYQATSSAGIKPGVRLRLAFWLDRPVPDEAWRELVPGLGLPLDLALYTPSQPAYLARPLFQGVQDPIPPAERSGTLPGAPEATLPAVDRAALEAGAALVRAARRVARVPEGARRTELNRSAYALAARWPETALPAAVIVEALGGSANRIGLPPAEVEFTLRNAIRDGRMQGGYSEPWRKDLALDEEANARSTEANVTLFLEHHAAFAGALAWNERTLCPVWVRPAPWGTTGAHGDADDARLVEWFQSQAGIQARPAWVRAGVGKSARVHSFDPLLEYLDGLPAWDGEDRLGTFFVRHFGVPDGDLVRAQSRAWFLGAARRARATLHSPVQMDTMIVLQGDPGTRKTTGLGALCPSPAFFDTSVGDWTDRDGLMVLARCWIVELGEMTHRRVDRDRMKAMITRQVDRMRLPYARELMEIPRRCALVGTTNEDTFLDDPTGSRRYWPMTVTRRADVDAIARERDLLWSEALHRARAGEPHWLAQDMERAAERVALAHRELDPVVDVLASALERARLAPNTLAWGPGEFVDGRIILLTLATACTLSGMSWRNRTEAMRVRQALRELGWTRRGRMGRHVWTPPADWAPVVDVGVAHARS